MLAASLLFNFNTFLFDEFRSRLTVIMSIILNFCWWRYNNWHLFYLTLLFNLIIYLFRLLDFGGKIPRGYGWCHDPLWNHWLALICMHRAFSLCEDESLVWAKTLPNTRRGLVVRLHYLLLILCFVITVLLFFSDSLLMILFYVYFLLLFQLLYPVIEMRCKIPDFER